MSSEELPEPLISPFVPEKVRLRRYDDRFATTYPAISYGLSSYGYDLTLSSKQFKVFRRIPGKVVDPKRFDLEFLHEATLNNLLGENWFILPANSYALGFVEEKLMMPENVTGICIGKSTYARAGIIVNMTPVEAG